MKKFGKNIKNKGITLIALVITIIVMLILVTVTISIAINGGLFEKAKEAVDSSNIEAAREIVTLAVQTVQIRSYTTPMDKNDIRNALEEEIERISRGKCNSYYFRRDIQG